MAKFSTIFFFLIFISASGISQQSDRPSYAPRGEKHRNVTDELGRKQGLWKHYNSERDLIWEVDYINNVRHGISRRFFVNQHVNRETEYHYGIKEGFFKRYYYTGELKTEGEYASGKKSNKWINYYRNGEVQSEGNYVYSRKEGEWKYYNYKGVMTNAITFKNGKDSREILAEEKRLSEAKKAAEAAAKKKAAKNMVSVKPITYPTNASVKDSTAR